MIFLLRSCSSKAKPSKGKAWQTDRQLTTLPLSFLFANQDKALAVHKLPREGPQTDSNDDSSSVVQNIMGSNPNATTSGGDNNLKSIPGDADAGEGGENVVDAGADGGKKNEDGKASVPTDDNNNKNANAVDVDNKRDGIVTVVVNDYKADVWRVGWNATGDTLAATGEDGRVTLWKKSWTEGWEVFDTV